MYLKVRVPDETRLNNDIYNLMPQASTNISVETILVLNCIGDIGVTWRMCVSKKTFDFGNLCLSSDCSHMCLFIVFRIYFPSKNNQNSSFETDIFLIFSLVFKILLRY